MRLGAGIYDWSEARGQFSIAYVGDFRHMTAGLLPIAARFGVEFGITPFGRAVPTELGGQDRFVFSNTTMYGGIRVERLPTNTQGIYAAIDLKWADISSREWRIGFTVAASLAIWRRILPFGIRAGASKRSQNELHEPHWHCDSGQSEFSDSL